MQKKWQLLLDQICSMKDGHGLYAMLYRHDIDIEELAGTLNDMVLKYTLLHAEAERAWHRSK